MKNRVLISCVGNKVSLVRAFKDAGWYVVGTDQNSDVVGKFYCDDFIHHGDITEFLTNRPQVDLIIPTSDKLLQWWARHRDRFDCPVMVANESAVYTCLNKKVFADFCGLPYLNYKQASIAIQKRPLFIRDTHGTGGSKSAHPIATKFDLDYWYVRFPGCLIQEYCDWPEYTIDLFADFDGNAISVVPRKRLFISYGESWVGQVDLNQAIVDESIKLSSQLGLIGHNTLQCFFDGQNVQWIEVNARFGGGFPLALAAGLNSPKMLLQLINGEQSDVPQIKDGLKMYRYTENLFI